MLETDEACKGVGAFANNSIVEGSRTELAAEMENCTGTICQASLWRCVETVGVATLDS